MLGSIFGPLERLLSQKASSFLATVFEGFDGDGFRLNLAEGIGGDQ